MSQTVSSWKQMSRKIIEGFGHKITHCILAMNCVFLEEKSYHAHPMKHRLKSRGRGDFYLPKNLNEAKLEFSAGVGKDPPNGV